MKALLLIFVRNPILGQVKTRLAMSIGNKQALKVYECLLQYTKKISSQLIDIHQQVHYADFLNENDLWNHFEKKLQIQNSSLGEKMCHAFEQGFENGFDNIIIIGSDCLELSTEILQNAFEQLTHHDVVIGPAKDGGYYLLGMKKTHHYLFQEKKWSTDSVFLDTIEDIRQHNLSHHLLPTLSDIDTENDLQQIEWLSICKQFIP